MSKISTEESPAGQDCTATIGELPLEAPHRSRRILQAGFFFLKFPCKIFHKSRKICKMGMGKYPPGAVSYTHLDVYKRQPLGILSAVKQNTIADYLIRFCSFIGNSLPNFFVSLLLMYFLAIRVRIFPVIAKDVSLKSVAMPAITLAIAMSAKYLRQVRATVLDELSKDYRCV